MQDEVFEATMNLRAFLFERVYRTKPFLDEEERAGRMISVLYEYYKKNLNFLPAFYRSVADTDGVDTAVSDYISSMSDGFVVKIFTELFVPKNWKL